MNSARQKALARLLATAIVGVVAMVVTGLGLGIVAGLAWLAFRWLTG